MIQVVIKRNFTKFDLSKSLSKKTGYSNLFTKKIINNLIDVLKIEVKKNNLKLKNLGSFKVIKKNQRIGRNPKTKESFVISSRKSLSFYPSKKLIKNLNK